MAADVADYRPARVETDKIREGEARQPGLLVKNPDILMEVKEPVMAVGFRHRVLPNFRDGGCQANTQRIGSIVARQLEDYYGEDADSSQVRHYRQRWEHHRSAPQPINV